MFTKQTCFVLGAGVSKPFKFPVGKELKQAICSPTAISSTTMEELLSISMAFDRNGHLDKGMTKYHVDTASRFIRSFSGSDMYSIDVWLEANQQDKQLLRIGKLAVAAIIIDAETRSKSSGAPVEQDWFA